MTTPSPTAATVVTAVKTAIDAVNPASGSVLESRSRYDSVLRFLEAYKQSDHSLDLWIVYVDGIQEIEGDATGEGYSIYHVVAEYYNLTVGSADWDKDARAQVETIRTALCGASSVFRIGGQIQLFTPETASVESQGFEDVEDQQVFIGRVGMQVEARRWA